MIYKEIEIKWKDFRVDFPMNLMPWMRLCWCSAFIKSYKTHFVDFLNSEYDCVENLKGFFIGIIQSLFSFDFIFKLILEESNDFCKVIPTSPNGDLDFLFR